MLIYLIAYAYTFTSTELSKRLKISLSCLLYSLLCAFLDCLGSIVTPSLD
jgi:hypothetical protein